ncbi:MAG: molybdopterin-dependent oxidoreductase, partial [Silicimonas sp.]|nr:molybdopterin-dependent oxidoreductase [Silicimonas sp.]
MTGPLSIFDKPNSYIGKSVPRPDARRLSEGRGRFVDDKQLPRMVHAAFLRSPYAHATIAGLDVAEARSMPGVVAVYTGADLADHVEPYVGVLSHLAGLRSAPQHPLAVDRVRWQGEPVVMVIAKSRAAAEDAVETIMPDYEELPALTDPEAALAADAPRLHAAFDSNLAWERTVDVGDVKAAFARDDVTIVERRFRFGRHTGVTLEARAALAEYDPAEDRLTFHYSGQAPHMMQYIFAKHLGLPEENVRVVAEDVGGSFGIKIHTYGDEIATAVAAKLL